MRLRARPDRLRRAHRHDARATRRLRDVLQLRRGRPPLRPRARRHARGAAQARRALRARSSARAATRRGRTRSSSSPTTARRRARPSSSATATASTSWSSARSPRARSPGIAGGDEQSSMVGHAVNEATGKKAKQAKNDVSDRDVVVLGSGNLGLIYLMEERRRLTLEEIDAAPPGALARPARASARRLAARALLRARRGRARRPRRPLPRGRPRRGRGPARAVLAHRAAAPAAHRRLRARRRHHGRQLLRPRARRGLRVRGADLLPRRHRRRPDTPVHPAPVAPRGAAGADHRRRERARHPRRLATDAPGRPDAPRGGAAGGRRRRRGGDRTVERERSPWRATIPSG